MSGIQGTTAASGANQTHPDPFANLNLTSQQESQLQQIFAQVKSGTLTPSQAQTQIDSLLTTQQQQTFASDKADLHAHHGYHDHGQPPSGSNPLSQLGLSSTQQSQISQIIQSAQTNGTSPADVLSQIDNVLTTAQQQQLASLFASAAAYTPTGTAPSSSTPPYVVSTNA